MIFALIVRALGFLGVGKTLANKLAPWVFGLAVIVTVGGGFALWLHFHDRGVVEQHDAKREAAAAGARETAASERVDDAVTNAKNEEDLHHAIDTAPTGGTLSPAAHALACERLRKLGRVPPACGPQGSGGAQADPR